MKSIITDLIEDYKESASYWSGSIFESVTHFSTDYKGKFGEELLFNLIKKHTEIPVEWDADSNTANDDGVYDLFWTLNGNKKRVEVKTSGRTVSNGRPIGWQHENVYYEDNKWDKRAASGGCEFPLAKEIRVFPIRFLLAVSLGNNIVNCI